MSSKRSFLNKIYTNTKDPGSFGGVERLLHSARVIHSNKDISRNDVTKFLRAQNTYTLHKPIRRKFLRNAIIVKGIDEQWQADLADVIELSRENCGFHYLLTVIDCFSKFAWVVPVKRKDANNIVEALKRFLHNQILERRKEFKQIKGKNLSMLQFKPIYGKKELNIL